MNECDAITRCAEYTTNYQVDRKHKDTYWSFDLHFDTAANNWSCTCYYDYIQYGDFHDDGVVGVSYGYGLATKARSGGSTIKKKRVPSEVEA